MFLKSRCRFNSKSFKRNYYHYAFVVFENFLHFEFVGFLSSCSRIPCNCTPFFPLVRRRSDFVASSTFSWLLCASQEKINSWQKSRLHVNAARLISLLAGVFLARIVTAFMRATKIIRLISKSNFGVFRYRNWLRKCIIS